MGSALMLIGAGAQAYGAYSNSKAAKAAYAAQGQIAENNAQIAGWQADDALQRGDREAMRARIRANQLKGAQRAAFGANGIDMGSGSALNILADTDYFGSVDVDTIRENAAKEAWAIRNQAANFQNDANLLRGRAESERPMVAAGTSLLTSAGKVAGKWY